jgi:hypothetical protein
MLHQIEEGKEIGEHVASSPLFKGLMGVLSD